MTNRQWILSTAAAVLLVTAASAGMLAFSDVYGVFRNPAGRQLPVYYADRTGKFLLSGRYVPANFDALLIGPSSSVNWEPTTITAGTGLRMYNESLEGGNASEERLLVDRTLSAGHFQLALVVLYPTMINSHVYNDGLDKARWTEALGSLDVYVQTALSVLKARGISVAHKQNASPDGSHEMKTGHGVLVTKDDIDFTVDRVGLGNLKAMVADLQAHGTRVVYVVPTVYQPLLVWNTRGFTRFMSLMETELPPASWIDLDAPEYQGFRSDPANYLDSYHVSIQGSREISRILNTRLQTILAQDAPRSPGAALSPKTPAAHATAPLPDLPSHI